MSASRAAFEVLKSGLELAPMDEVKRRAEVCLNCPLNQPMQGCACAPLYKLIATLVPEDRKLEGLNVCQVCNCSLLAKVNLLEDHIFKSNQGRNFSWPAGACWQKDIMENHNAPESAHP
jgi:hypothetical protein